MSSERSPTSMLIGTVKTCGTDGDKPVLKPIHLYNKDGKKRMAESAFINATDNPHKAIGFTSPVTRTQGSNSTQPPYKGRVSTRL